MSPIKPHWAQPSHPDLVEVINAPEAYTSLSRSLVTLAPGALVACLDMPPMTYSAEKAYSTVQVSPDRHVELNCDFLYMNHSCEPSIELQVAQGAHSTYEGFASNEIKEIAETGIHETSVAIEIRVSSKKTLHKGDELTFFYPSTEWEMAQPFDCNCGVGTCHKRISGAKDMNPASLDGVFFNEHIKLLFEAQQNGKLNGAHVARYCEASARALAGEMGGDTRL